MEEIKTKADADALRDGDYIALYSNRGIGSNLLLIGRLMRIDPISSTYYVEVCVVPRSCEVHKAGVINTIPDWYESGDTVEFDSSGSNYDADSQAELARYNEDIHYLSLFNGDDWSCTKKRCWKLTDKEVYKHVLLETI